MAAVVLLRVQPDVRRRSLAQQAVVLHVVAPRKYGKTADAEGAEGDGGRRLFLFGRGRQQPRIPQLFFHLLQIDKAFRSRQGGEHALRVVEVRLRLPLLRLHGGNGALLLVVFFEVLLRVLRGGERLVEGDAHHGGGFPVIVDDFAPFHTLAQGVDVGGEQLAEDAVRFHIAAFPLPFQ